MKTFAAHVVQADGRRSTPIGLVHGRARSDALARLHAVDRRKGRAERIYRLKEIEPLPDPRCTWPELQGLTARLQSARQEAGLA